MVHTVAHKCSLLSFQGRHSHTSANAYLMKVLQVLLVQGVADSAEGLVKAQMLLQH